MSLCYWCRRGCVRCETPKLAADVRIEELTSLVHALADRLGACSHALGRVADRQPATRLRHAGEPNPYRNTR